MTLLPSLEKLMAQDPYAEAAIQGRVQKASIELSLGMSDADFDRYLGPYLNCRLRARVQMYGDVTLEVPSAGSSLDRSNYPMSTAVECEVYPNRDEPNGRPGLRMGSIGNAMRIDCDGTVRSFQLWIDTGTSYEVRTHVKVTNLWQMKAGNQVNLTPLPPELGKPLEFDASAARAAVAQADEAFE